MQARRIIALRSDGKRRGGRITGLIPAPELWTYHNRWYESMRTPKAGAAVVGLVPVGDPRAGRDNKNNVGGSVGEGNNAGQYYCPCTTTSLPPRHGTCHPISILGTTGSVLEAFLKVSEKLPRQQRRAQTVKIDVLPFPPADATTTTVH